MYPELFRIGGFPVNTYGVLLALAFMAALFVASRLGALSLLLAGVAGNLTDRVRLGHVIDFIEVFIGSYQWPTFNVADAAICVGAGLLALDLFLEGREEGKGDRGRVSGVGPRGKTSSQPTPDA